MANKAFTHSSQRCRHQWRDDVPEAPKGQIGRYTQRLAASGVSVVATLGKP